MDWLLALRKNNVNYPFEIVLDDIGNVLSEDLWRIVKGTDAEKPLYNYRDFYGQEPVFLAIERWWNRFIEDEHEPLIPTMERLIQYLASISFQVEVDRAYSQLSYRPE